MATASQNTEQLRGLVKTLTYTNDENGYFVAKVSVEGKGEKTVIGYTPVIHVGEKIIATGSWQSSNYGPQFKAKDVRLSPPDNTDGIVTYLASSVPGVGKAFASKLVDVFGSDIFEVIEHTPEKIAAVKGIGPKRAQSLVDAYAEQKSLREIMVFLYKVGLSQAKANAVYARYKEDAIETIKQNPYVLCSHIWGVGFQSADAVAQKMGIEHDSEYRVCAGVQHVIKEAQNNGSCGLPVEDVLAKAGELLKVEQAAVQHGIDLEVFGERLVLDRTRGKECLFSPVIYSAEKRIAEILIEHAKGSAALRVDPKRLDALITAAEEKFGITLDPTQRDAVHLATSSSVCVVTGGPGTGKTTITRVTLEVLAKLGCHNICTAAPTGKAAKRAQEATGIAASTLHRLLGVRDGKFVHNEKNPLECGVLAVDEWSMADVLQTAAVLRALPPDARLILLGDVDQLPSVGPGRVLADILDSKVIPSVKLTQVFRQGAGSDIKLNAHKINQGVMPELGWREGSDFCFIPMAPKDKDSDESKKECRAQIEAELLRIAQNIYKRGFDPIKDLQVLCPMRKGILGAESLNTRLQAVLNPRPSAFQEIRGVKWCVGDKVMQIRNNYDKKVFNGDVGYVLEIDKSAATVTVDFEDQHVVYKYSEMDDLVLAYAYSIHKSQGSEAPVVIIPLDWSHFTMLKRNLFYTGLTRAKKLFIGLGQPSALQVAVRTAQVDERYSMLKDWLQKLANGSKSRVNPDLATVGEVA